MTELAVLVAFSNVHVFEYHAAWRYNVCHSAVNSIAIGERFWLRAILAFHACGLQLRFARVTLE